MSMPKGFKASNGYATVSDFGGLGYREIAETMTEMGYPMKHSAARNYFLEAMRKLAAPIASFYGLADTDVDRIAADPRFQEAIASLLEEI
jgi:hypothetical protein